MKCIYRHISQWMDEREKQINGEKSARMEEGPNMKFTSRPTIWNFFQRQLSLELQLRGKGKGLTLKNNWASVKKQAKSNILHTNLCSQDGIQAQYLQSDIPLLPKSCPLTNIGKIQKRRKISSKCRSFRTLSWLLESCCDLDSMTPWGAGSREKDRRQNSNI